MATGNRNWLITVAVTFLLLNGGATVAQTNWPTFGFDSQRTGYNPSETVLSVATVPNLQLQWAENFGCPFTAQPIEVNSVLYVADWCGVIHAVDPSSGNVFWARQLGTSPTSCGDFAPLSSVGILGTPAFDTANNRIFVVSGDDRLHALDPVTGSDQPGYPVWVINGPNRAPNTVVYSSPLLVGNSLYITSAGERDNPPYHRSGAAG
jgi:outer membrane protein assembly factor BamB